MIPVFHSNVSFMTDHIMMDIHMESDIAPFMRRECILRRYELFNTA